MELLSDRAQCYKLYLKIRGGIINTKSNKNSKDFERVLIFCIILSTSKKGFLRQLKVSGLILLAL